MGTGTEASCRLNPVSYREHGLPVSENLLSTTYPPAARITSGWMTSCIFAPVKCWLYLAAVIDLWLRSVMPSVMPAQLDCDKLQMAWWWRKHPG